MSTASSFNPLALSAGKAPPGLSPHDRNTSYHGVPMTVVLSLFADMTLTFYGIRIHTKVTVVRRVGWDEFLCTLGMIGALLNIVCFGIASLASIDGPLGKHMWNITLGDFLADNFVITGYIMQVTASATLGIIKLTIFLLYLDIFWPLKWCRWTIHIGASLSSTFYLSMTIVQFYFMTPRPGETIAKHFGGKLAARVTTLSIPTTSIGFAIDILLLIIPLRAVVQLQMAKKKRVRLILTFLVGIMAILGSIFTLAFKIKTYGNPDLTYHLILVNFFICVEMIFGICIASSPLVSRAVSYHRNKLSSFSRSFLSPFLSIRKSFATRSATDHKSNEAYDAERASESESRLVELRKLKQVPTPPDERFLYTDADKNEGVTVTAH